MNDTAASYKTMTNAEALFVWTLIQEAMMRKNPIMLKWLIK